MTDRLPVEQIDERSPRLYERGLVVAHSSTDDGMPDVGMSVGLGNNMMLYAGDLPNPLSTGLAIYTDKDRFLIANDVDFQDARILIEMVGAAFQPEE